MSGEGAPPPTVPLSDDRPPAPSFAEAAGQVLLRQVRATVRGKRLVVALVAAALAPFLTLVFPNPDPVGLIRTIVYLEFALLVPVTALTLGSGLLYDEAEEGTLTFLFTAPVSRGAVLLGKWAAGLATGWVLLLASLGATVLVSPADPEKTSRFVRASFVAITLGYPAYLGVFSLLGTLFRRGFIAGVIYYAFDFVVSWIPGAAKRISIRHFADSLLVPYAEDRSPFEGEFLLFAPDGEVTCVAVLLSVALVTVAVCVLVANLKEYQARNVQG